MSYNDLTFSKKFKLNLILHIGTEKTGSTSIQAFLKKNIDQLKQNGVYVPQTPMVGAGNHRWIPLLANNDRFSDDFVISQQFKNEEDRKEKIFYKKKQFINECQNASTACKTLILTSEHFQSRLRTVEQIQRLRKLLEELASRIRIIIYIRDPLKTAVSLLSTQIKSGGSPASLPSPNQKYFENICNHSQTIKRWKECFPNAEVVVRRFEKGLLEKDDIVTDFCSQVIDEFRVEEYEFLKPSNETLSLSGMALLRKLNLVFPKFVDKKPNPMRGQISQFVMKNTLDGTKFLPCRDEFAAYKKHFSESCESVRAAYFPLEESLFIDQNEFAEEKIDLSEVEIDPYILENLIESLWSQKRKLEMRLKNVK